MNRLSFQPGASPLRPAASPVSGVWGIVAAVLVLVALAMPSVGPLVDHHFAERHFNHAHLFLAAADSEHQHLLELGHHHAASYTGTPVGPGAAADGVYLTSTDAAGNGIPALAPAATGVSPVFPDSGGRWFGYRYDDAENRLSEAFPGQAKKPPRT